MDKQLKQSEHSIRASEAEVQRWEDQIEQQLASTIRDEPPDITITVDTTEAIISEKYDVEPFANGEPGEVPFHEMVDLQNKLASAEADSLFLGNTVSSLMEQREGLPVCQERVEEALRICAKFKARHQEAETSATNNSSWADLSANRTPERQHSMSRTL